jgi:phosphomannomutase
MARAKPTVEPDLEPLHGRLRSAAAAAGVPRDTVEPAIAARDYFAVLEQFVPRRAQVDAKTGAELREAAEALLQVKLYSHPNQLGKRVPIVFGTGGHRGEIGLGLTLAHVYAIVTALIRQIEQMSPAERRVHCGASDLPTVKEKGFVIGHDNRLFNSQFSHYTASLLREAGFRVRYAGRASTPELSRVIPHLGWAGAVNFTPSHNPFRYGGIKTNPADGGLAGTDLTAPLETEANRILEELPEVNWPGFDELAARIEAEGARVERVDVHAPYLACLEAHPVLRLGELSERLREMGRERRLRWVVDPVWGASVPVYQRIQERVGPEVMTLIHIEDDPYFGGQTTEPNEQTLRDALSLLQADPARFKVAIRNDPDSDRGLVGDDGGAIKTNRFSALAMRFLNDIGASGDIATTLPTSHFGPDYARAHGQAVHITPTGFKHFRPFLQRGGTMLAYEESDGLTIAGHSLDKDGVVTGLLALRIVLHYRRSLSDLLSEIEREIGKYHWEQITFMIEISAREALKKLAKLAEYQPGQKLQADGRTYTLVAVDAQDGYKFFFEDGSWVMMRPSGTEPKVRVYAETRESPAATRTLSELGKRLALEAIHD